MKKYFLTGFALVFLSAFAFSQTDIPLKYTTNITEQGLKKQLTIIASAEMEGRETGTRGQRKAASYIESQFREIGLQYPESLKGYQQYYPLFKDTLISRRMKIGRRDLRYGKDYILQTGSSLATRLKASAIVFAGYGIEDSNYNDYAGKDVKDKIVLIFNGEPQVNENYLVTGTNRQSKWGYSISAKAVLAKEKGAVAVLFVNPLWDSIPPALVENSKKTNLYFPHLSDKPKATVISIIPSLLKYIVGANEANVIIETAKSRGPLNNFNIEKEIKTKLILKKRSI
ncbi:MAG: PA domain-containing protein, partial [Ginsengibacter sp.]